MTLIIATIFRYDRCVYPTYMISLLSIVRHYGNTDAFIIKTTDRTYNCLNPERLTCSAYAVSIRKSTRSGISSGSLKTVTDAPIQSIYRIINALMIFVVTMSESIFEIKLRPIAPMICLHINNNRTPQTSCECFDNWNK